MALEVFVSPFFGLVFDNLSSLIENEIGLVLGVRKELKKLSDILSTIQDVLQDAEVKQIDDKPINNWLTKLKDLVYEADDILDECATEALIPKSDIVKNRNRNTQVTSPSGSTCFNFKGIMFRRSIGKRIKTLSEKFDEMAELRSKFQLNLTPTHTESGRNDHRETSSTLTEPQVYGREKEKEHIANLLLKGGDDVSVCCIVGMGGLGKTTLAQLVYNDESIANHFQLKCWVCVSDDFVPKTLLKSIIESTGGNARDLEDLDPLERRVQGILSGKKFLLVLDDVWNEDQTKWYKLKSLLTCGGRGSSIIVTTRLESVASLTGTLPIQRLETLSEEDCWSLFKHYAFDKENEKHHQILEEIGKEIVEKCGGVPLAAKALGGLLRFKKTENEWLFVRDSALWDLPQDKEDAILPALRLSYNHLALHLKQCFSFCSIFPKDYEMKKEELIHLWMANGFIQPKGDMGLEDIGNEIFNELLLRSFFQDVEKDKYGDIVDCKMHDLMHDLACSITMNECTTVEVSEDNNAFKLPTRHLVLDFTYAFSSEGISNSFVLESQPLRTLILRDDLKMLANWFIQGLTYSNLKFLRVLDLRYWDMKKLHVSIGNLKHLRYLDLSFCENMRSLPDESICNLRNLQVLKLNFCTKLEVLPANMRKLTNLRHLGIEGCDALREMPVGMRSLSCLRTLSMFIIVPKIGCSITELQGLDHLSGKLTIKGLEHVRNSKEAKDANLMKKKNLRDLSLIWSYWSFLIWSYDEEEEEQLASIGEGLQPHPNVQMLDLEYYNGFKFPSWMSHLCLPNLTKISLVGCRRCEHLPTLGKLPLLEVLEISEIDSLKCIGDEFYGDHHPQGGSFFPSLKSLKICDMPNLEEWYSSSSSSSTEEEEEEMFTSLRSLNLRGCPKLRSMPRLSPSLKILQLSLGKEMILESLPPYLSTLEIEGSYLSTLEIEGYDRDHEFLLHERSWAMILQKFVCLQSLKISDCDQIKTLPENLPTTLTELYISYCTQMVSLPGVMQNLTSLKILEISFCRSLKCLPELGSRNTTTVLTKLVIRNCDGLTSVSDCLRHLTALEDLKIDHCSELEFLPGDFQDLSSLRSLIIWGLPQMTCLPEGLQQVAETLENLEIIFCSGLTSLPEWMDKFTSLQRLYIHTSENLKILSEEVLHLASLKNLAIHNCHPDLHRRYAEETGEDWHKIAHIPNLYITEPKIEHDIGGGSSGKRWMKCNMIPCFSYGYWHKMRTGTRSSSSSSSGTN